MNNIRTKFGQGANRLNLNESWTKIKIYFSTMPKYDIYAWSCILLGLIFIVLGLIMLE